MDQTAAAPVTAGTEQHDAHAFDADLVTTFIGIEEEAAAILSSSASTTAAPMPSGSASEQVLSPSWRDAAQLAFEANLSAPPADHEARHEYSSAAPPTAGAEVTPLADVADAAAVNSGSTVQERETPVAPTDTSPRAYLSSKRGLLAILLSCGCASTSGVSAELPSKLSFAPPLTVAHQQDAASVDSGRAVTPTVPAEHSAAAGVESPAAIAEPSTSVDSEHAPVPASDHAPPEICELITSEVPDQTYAAGLETAAEQRDESDVDVGVTPVMGTALSPGMLSRLTTILEVDECHEEEIRTQTHTPPGETVPVVQADEVLPVHHNQVDVVIIASDTAAPVELPAPVSSGQMTLQAEAEAIVTQIEASTAELCASASGDVSNASASDQPPPAEVSVTVPSTPHDSPVPSSSSWFWRMVTISCVSKAAVQATPPLATPAATQSETITTEPVAGVPVSEASPASGQPPSSLRSRLHAAVRTLVTPAQGSPRRRAKLAEIDPINKERLSLRARVAARAEAPSRPLNSGTAGCSHVDTSIVKALDTLRSNERSDEAEELSLFAQEVHLQEALALLAMLQQPANVQASHVSAGMARMLADAYVDVVIGLHDAQMSTGSQAQRISSSLLSLAHTCDTATGSFTRQAADLLTEQLAALPSLLDACSISAARILRPLEHGCSLAQLAPRSTDPLTGQIVADIRSFLAEFESDAAHTDARVHATMLLYDVKPSASLLSLCEIACEAAALVDAAAARFARAALSLRSRMQAVLLPLLVPFTLSTVSLHECVLVWMPLMEGVDVTAADHVPESTLRDVLASAHRSAVLLLSSTEVQVGRIMLIRQRAASAPPAESLPLSAPTSCVASAAASQLSITFASNQWQQAVDPIPDVPTPPAVEAARAPPPHARWESARVQAAIVSAAVKTAVEKHIRAVAEAQRKVTAAQDMEKFVLAPPKTSAAAQVMWRQTSSETGTVAMSSGCAPVSLPVLQNLYALPSPSDATHSAPKPLQRVASLLCSCTVCTTCVDGVLATERVAAQYRGVLRFGASPLTDAADACQTPHLLQQDESTVWIDLSLIPLRARPSALEAQALLAFSLALQDVMHTSSVLHALFQLCASVDPPSDARILMVFESVLAILGEPVSPARLASPASPSRTLAQQQYADKWQSLRLCMSRSVLHRVLTYDAGRTNGCVGWIGPTAQAITALPAAKPPAPATEVIVKLPPTPMTPSRLKRIREESAALANLKLPTSPAPRDAADTPSSPGFSPIGTMRLDESDITTPVREPAPILEDVASLDVRSIACSSPAVALLLRWVTTVRAFHVRMRDLKGELDSELSRRTQAQVAPIEPAGRTFVLQR